MHPAPPRPINETRPPRAYVVVPPRPVRARTARDVALTAIRDVLHNQAYASQALSRALSDSQLSDADRRLAASMFYYTVENHIYLEWALGRMMETKAETVVMDILHLAAAQILFMDKIPDHAAVNEAVEQVRAEGRGGLDKLVNGVQRNLIRASDDQALTLPDSTSDPDDYLSVRYSLAIPAVKRLESAYGFEAAEQIASYSHKDRSITIRPNRTKIDPASFETMLNREGFSWKHGIVRDAYILTDAGDLSAHGGYRGGLFSIQGESSMLAAQAVEAEPGMQILDACAAPGGKTCLRAEARGSSGRVHAWDLHSHRVELIRAAARRLGLENVRPAVHDASIPMESMELSMDAVLVDAPCSGLGVMADKPDIRFKIDDAQLDTLPGVQAKSLAACAPAVRWGGRLGYSTCTILAEVNQAQIQAFLDRHPEFEMDQDAGWLPEGLQDRLENGTIQLMPPWDDMEGFFIARMIRRSA